MIKIDNLTKEYSVIKAEQPSLLRKWFYPLMETKIALDHINLQVGEGSSLAILGPNGAGKSTLIKILTSILTPTSGDVRVFGFEPSRERMQYTPHIGVVMGQKSLLYWDIPIIESLRLFGAIYGLSSTRLQQNLEFFDAMFSMRDLLHVPVRQLSLGQRMRCELVAAFLHMPKILFLDEPTIGLDLPTKISFLGYLKALRSEMKCTVLLATHALQEVEYLSDRIIILNHGKIIFDAPPQTLKQKIPYRRVTFSKKMIRDDIAHKICMNKYGFSEKETVEIDIHMSNIEVFLRDIMNSIVIENLTIEEPTIETAIKDFFK